METHTVSTDKTHSGYLPTTPGTQMIFETGKPWCGGHRWSSRNLTTNYLHWLGHRLRLLRVNAPHPITNWVGK